MRLLIAPVLILLAAVAAPAAAVAEAHAPMDRYGYWIDGGPDAEFRPGGTFALKADDAVAYRRAPRGLAPDPAAALTQGQGSGSAAMRRSTPGLRTSIART
jgi:hypothetical protein